MTLAEASNPTDRDRVMSSTYSFAAVAGLDFSSIHSYVGKRSLMTMGLGRLPKSPGPGHLLNGPCMQSTDG
jgi:hypothetical protein